MKVMLLLLALCDQYYLIQASDHGSDGLKRPLSPAKSVLHFWDDVQERRECSNGKYLPNRLAAPKV